MLNKEVSLMKRMEFTPPLAQMDQSPCSLSVHSSTYDYMDYTLDKMYKQEALSGLENGMG